MSDALGCSHCDEVFVFGDHPEETFEAFARHHDRAHPECLVDQSVTVVDLSREGLDLDFFAVEDLGISVLPPLADPRLN